MLEDPEGALAVFTAVEQLADTLTAAIVPHSREHRAAIRRAAAERLWQAVARSTAQRGNDELDVLADAVEDMDVWLGRLPVESGWAVAFRQSQGYLLEEIGA